MSSNNISSNGVKIIISGIPYLPALTITGYSADSDFWVTEDIETGSSGVTPDGQRYFHGKNAIIKATLTLNPSSREADILSTALKLQRKVGKLPAVIANVSVVVVNEATGTTETYVDGIICSGSSGRSYGAEKQSDRKFVFEFGDRI